MAISSSSRADQKTVAKALGITPRRVRQLVAADLLPEPDEGAYDLERCRQFYALYTNGSPRDWTDFHHEMKAASVRVERLIDKALIGKKADLEAAGTAAAELFDGLKFSVAAQSNSDAERAFNKLIFDDLKRDVFGPLIRRSYQILGAEKGMGEATIEAAIEALGN